MVTCACNDLAQVLLHGLWMHCPEEIVQRCS